MSKRNKPAFIMSNQTHIEPARLLTSHDVGMIGGKAMMITSLSSLIVYLVLGHWGIIIVLSFWLAIGLGNVLKFIKKNTVTIDTPPDDATVN